MYLVLYLVKAMIYILFIRIWLQMAQADFYNPFSQVIVKITQPFTSGLRQLLPRCRRFDLASFIIALILICLPLIIQVVQLKMATELLHINVLFSLLFTLLKAALFITFNLIYWVIIIRAVLSWVAQYQHPFNILLYQLTEPLLLPIRRILPAFGGLDFSPMVLLFILIALQYVI